METKADIRKEALKLRSSFGEKERKAAEKKIAKRLLESSFYIVMSLSGTRWIRLEL